MSDTTTLLNLGTGGDSMDESLVTQSDGTTQAKRPRVVIGGDAGYNGTENDTVQPVSEDPASSVMALPVLSTAVVNDTPNAYVPGELRALSVTSEGRLRVTVGGVSNLSVRFVGDEENPWTGSPWSGDTSTSCTQSNSPWEGW